MESKADFFHGSPVFRDMLRGTHGKACITAEVFFGEDPHGIARKSVPLREKISCEENPPYKQVQNVFLGEGVWDERFRIVCFCSMLLKMVWVF